MRPKSSFKTRPMINLWCLSPVSVMSTVPPSSYLACSMLWCFRVASRPQRSALAGSHSSYTGNQSACLWTAHVHIIICSYYEQYYYLTQTEVVAMPPKKRSWQRNLWTSESQANILYPLAITAQFLFLLSFLAIFHTHIFLVCLFSASDPDPLVMSAHVIKVCLEKTSVTHCHKVKSIISNEQVSADLVTMIPFCFYRLLCVLRLGIWIKKWRFWKKCKNLKGCYFFYHNTFVSSRWYVVISLAQIYSISVSVLSSCF